MLQRLIIVIYCKRIVSETDAEVATFKASLLNILHLFELKLNVSNKCFLIYKISLHMRLLFVLCIRNLFKLLSPRVIQNNFVPSVRTPQTNLTGRQSQP